MQKGLCCPAFTHCSRRKLEAVGEKVLLAHGPCAREPEALAQPQHGPEALDGASDSVEGAETTNPGPVLQPEVFALDTLLQVLGDVVIGERARRPLFRAVTIAGG
jgi:hypothetical protein